MVTSFLFQATILLFFFRLQSYTYVEVSLAEHSGISCFPLTMHRITLTICYMSDYTTSKLDKLLAFTELKKTFF